LLESCRRGGRQLYQSATTEALSRARILAKVLMLGQILITTQDNEHYFITVARKEFLKWMTDMSLPENKPF
jgi:hypothetical protein